MKKCKRCKGKGYVELDEEGIFGDCPECLAIGEELTPEECKKGNHNHCEDLVFEGQGYRVCHDCQKSWRKCEVYSRVVGYLRPTNSWNHGKKAEFTMRKPYKLMSGLDRGLNGK